MSTDPPREGKVTERRLFIGGSDARIIMGDDEAALLRLWREKRGEVDARGPVRQPDCATRPRHREAEPTLVASQYRADGHRCPAMGPPSNPSVDGGDPRRRVEGGDVFESKFMLPWPFSEEAAAEKYMPRETHLAERYRGLDRRRVLVGKDVHRDTRPDLAVGPSCPSLLVPGRSLSQSDAGAAAVLVDEFHAGELQRGAHLHPCLVATAQKAVLSFQSLYRWDRHISRRCQIPL